MNDKPFRILLDSYDKECYTLYVFIRSLFDYPEIGEDEDLEGKLYASAFAYLCSDYLKATVDMVEYDDFELFIEEMNFIAYQDEVKSHPALANKEDDFLEMVWGLIGHFRSKIRQDINGVFGTPILKMRLFSTVFQLEDSSFMPEMTTEVMDFFVNEL